MIFAAITGTPCIELSNYKIKGTYQWIRDLEYIKFTDDIGKISELMDDLKKVKNIKYDNSKIKKEYEKIIEAITV